MEDEAPPTRHVSRGRTFVYVLPCRHEDILKVGYSRDPLERFRTLHRRFFEFFDLDRGLLIDTDRLREARQVERLFITTFAEQRAPAPLVVRQAAAGHTEWFRGIAPEAEALAHRLRDALDTCAALGMDLSVLVPVEVLDWYRSADYFGSR